MTPPSAVTGVTRVRNPWVITALAGIAFALAATWMSFVDTWLAERSHGFLIMLYTVWYIYQHRDDFRADDTWRVQAVLLGVVFAILWACSMIVGVRVVNQAAALGLLVSWSVALFGTSAVRTLLPIAGIVALALPLWEIFVPALQAMTVAVNHQLVRLLGLPAEIEGNLIHFPFGTIEVAQSCAGLAFFLTALTIGAIYAQHFLRTGRARAVAIVLAVALALVSNWIRVFGLVVIGFRTRMQSPLMTDHGTYGWIIFAVVMVVYFTLTARIERWEATLAGSSLGGEPAVRRNDENVDLRSSLTITAFVLAPVIVFELLNLRPLPTGLPDPVPGIQAPDSWLTVPSDNASVESTKAKRLWEPAMSGAAFRRTAELVPAPLLDYPRVRLDRLGYLGTRQGHELIGYGNAIAPAQILLEDHVIGPLDRSLRMVRQAVVREGQGPRVIWYWYRVAEIETASPTRAKLAELLAFFTRRTPSELIAVSAPCGSADCKRAIEALHLVVTGQPVSGTSDM